jgi:hypothetical protein
MTYMSGTSIILFSVTLAAGASTWELEGRDSLSVQLQPGAAVVISNMNGSIHIEGWGSEEVFVGYSVRDPLLGPGYLDIICDETDGISCRVASNGGTAQGLQQVIDFLVRVPEDIDLRIVTETFMGDISLTAFSGSSLVEIIQGSVSIQGIGGELTVNMVSGNIDLADSPGLRMVNIVQGSFIADIDEVLGDIHITSVEGLIDLRIPEGVVVNASTISGELDIPGVEVREELMGKFSHFGSGEHTMIIESFSGDIRIRLR